MWPPTSQQSRFVGQQFYDLFPLFHLELFGIVCHEELKLLRFDRFAHMENQLREIQKPNLFCVGAYQ